MRRVCYIFISFAQFDQLPHLTSSALALANTFGHNLRHARDAPKHVISHRIITPARVQFKESRAFDAPHKPTLHTIAALNFPTTTSHWAIARSLYANHKVAANEIEGGTK